MTTWKDIPEYEGRYQVSSDGRVRSLSYRHGKRTSPKELNLSKNAKGYLRLQLTKNGKSKNMRVHRLVALTFLGESGLQIDHKNGIKTDNRVENLEYVTCKENINRWRIATPPRIADGR